MTQRIRALHVPLGTRCEAITQHPAQSGLFVWRVWIAIKNKQVPPEKYQGTYLELMPDGSIYQYNNETEENYEVMESVYESNRSIRS